MSAYLRQSSVDEIKLGEAVFFQRGFDITKSEQTEGDVPIVSSSGVSSFHNQWKATGPGVVIGRKGTLGTVHYLKGNYWPHDTTLWVKDFRGNDVRLVYYFLQTLHLENFDAGSSNPTLNRNHIHKIKVLFPKQRVQTKIAAILSAYDELIENNRRRIALLEKMAEEIYREWFVRMRFPGHDKTKFEKGVPSGWDVRTLDSLAIEIRNGVKKKNMSDDAVYIGLEHIPRRSISIKECSTADTVDSDKLAFRERDILFGKIRPYLHKVSLAHFSGLCSSDTIVLRPRERIYEGYVLFTVFSETFVELASVASKGTKMPRADWDFLKKLELTVPSAALLEAYQSLFDSLFSQIVNLLRANKYLNASRQGLLLRLISGKLSVENLAIRFPHSMLSETAAQEPQAAHA